MKSKVCKVGELEVMLEEGGLRYISYNGIEIVRGIYAAVRDQDWGTVTPRFNDLHITEDDRGITIIFTCEHVQGDIDFVWKGSIRLMEDGLQFDFDGQARSTFLRNRIGLCVLHPMEFAGLATAVHTSSSHVHGEFPHAISPHQPFKEIKSMMYEPAKGCHVNMTFDGDLFEMEDQRNWTDASYKTYCTPLELLFPVRVQAGQVIRQSIKVEITGIPVEGKLSEYSSIARIKLHHNPICQLPEIGFTSANAEPSAQETDLLKQLHPSHLRLVLDLTQEVWRKHLELAIASADTYRCGLELEIIMDSKDVFRELAFIIAERSIPVLRLFPIQSGKYVSESQTIRSVKQALQAAGLQIPVGGGARAYYAEFNRATLPLVDMDFAVYSINPQVHAFDDRSLMETLTAQGVTAVDALAKSGKPLYVGPITFKPRMNPNASSGCGISMQDQRDDRQSDMFGAAWLLGSVAALCLNGVKGVTYFETFGPIGFIDGQHANPIYYVIKHITEFAGATVMANSRTSNSITVLALRRGSQMRVLIANMTSEMMEAAITTGAYTNACIREFHDSSMNPSVTNRMESEEIKVTLKKYGYVCIDIEE